MIGENTPITEIAQALDAMDAQTRWSQFQSMGRSDMRELYARAEASAPLTLDDFVPHGVPSRVPVVHRGRNSLPLPQSQRFFSKVMCRPEGQDDRLFGFNDAPLGWMLGPGYYIAVPTAGESAWEARGSVVVDYFRVPDGPVAPGWPRVRANWVGLQVLVYHRTRDFMRRVSSQVTIGAAYKAERKLDHYFILVREDPEAE
jgi:hypothetical protein